MNQLDYYGYMNEFREPRYEEKLADFMDAYHEFMVAMGYYKLG